MIGWPRASLMLLTTTFADAPTIVALPPKFAPDDQRPDQRLHIEGLPELLDQRHHRDRVRDVVDDRRKDGAHPEHEHRGDVGAPSADREDLLRQIADDPRLHDGAHEDEEPDEEEQRRPLDGLQDLVHVLPGEDHQHHRAGERDRRSLEAQRPAEQEADDRDASTASRERMSRTSSIRRSSATRRSMSSGSSAVTARAQLVAEEPARE